MKKTRLKALMVRSRLKNKCLNSMSEENKKKLYETKKYLCETFE